MPSWVITGANRGLGLEFVTQLSANTSNSIIAGVRSLSSDLSSLASLQNKTKNIHVLQCDTSSVPSIAAFAESVASILGKDRRIDYLLNNAGIDSVPDETSLNLTAEGLRDQFTVNVLGPAKTTELLLPQLHRGSKVMNMTSLLSSMTRTLALGYSQSTTYSISKAALNMLTVHQSLDLKEKGVVVVCMDPGWVRTRMGGEDADLEAEDSIRGMIQCLEGLGEGDSGKFLEYTGEEKHW
jgi:NAD(P)-dependent dehydrogenase (short-subunit alcohol dehydrogenase family)